MTGCRARVTAYKDYLSICGSAPSDVLATIALRARDRVLARKMDLVKESLALVDAFMASQAAAFQWVRPRAGTVGFPRLRADWSAPDFREALIQQESVLLLPGSLFGHAGNHVRLGFGRRDLPEAMERLQRYLARRR